MPFRFQYRRYRVSLRVPLRTAHEVWTERDGIIVRVEDESGRLGWGEIAPIPAFGTETVAEAEVACRGLGERITGAMDDVPATLGCTRGAIVAALREISAQGEDRAAREAHRDFGERGAYRAVAALLPAGRGAAAQLAEKAEAGFRVFKWKVGVADIADELVLLDDLCAAMPTGARLRLDANGAWNRRDAERWLERCAERPVEYVEQPCFVPASEDEAARRRVDDLLLGLATDYPTPIALDESLVGDSDVERWLGAGWPGWFVVKPSLMANVARLCERLAAAKATVVFSSALETAVGARAALRVAFSWPGEGKALGFGVWPLFGDARFDGPAAAPFLREADVERINPETVWNALS